MEVMVYDVDVFCPIMVDRVLGKREGSRVVVVNSSRFVDLRES